MTEGTIQERIFQLINTEKSQAAFNKKTGWTSGDISHLKNKPDKSIALEKLKCILDAYPSVSAEWLMRGEGEMNRVKGDSNHINVQLAQGVANSNSYNACMQEVEHLKALLAEKERTIQILMKG